MSDLDRLRFLCRRGMKELDVLFGGFLTFWAIQLMGR